MVSEDKALKKRIIAFDSTIYKNLKIIKESNFKFYVLAY